MMKIGDNIKKYRLLNDYNNLQFSKKSGLSRSYIFELEKGTYENIGVKVLCKLCKALEVTPNQIIPEEMWKGEDDGTTDNK